MIAVKDGSAIARAIVKEIAKFEKVMSTVEEHPDLVSEETDYRLARLEQRLREFVAARLPRE